ncbi:hypothetical protein GOP47_0000830 [Adiantum capillus-veneris]|uniref:Farnesyl pyrophosphate synthase n=1 Tax=Adiantum capillus-veneris TaxID=13818 RepID=A0A9D4VDQ6_ADICA|nr:hypothetical protein GOP47_0000830 [Adiantum capillus-veneris]
MMAPNADPDVAKGAPANRAEFLEVYQKLKSQLLEDTEAFTYTDDSRRWVARMLDYNVPGGKLNRGLSVVDSLKHLKNGVELSEEEKFLASVLGWCIEWLQAYFLVLDDIMDSSITRRGQPCWYRVPQVGFIAINDGILLRNHIFRMLRWYFRSKAYYLELNDLFNEVEFQTSAGQMLGLITTPAGEVDLSKYVISTYIKIVQCKTAYYSVYLPVACALLMMGKNLENYKPTQDILDDYLDCYGDPHFIGKIGTDIEDSKCSWLIVQALKRANSDRRQCLLDNYGKADPTCVSKVKTIYNELALQSVFSEYEKEVYDKLVAEIENQEDHALQTVLKAFLGKIHKRQK